MRTLLVTGASGFVGRHLIERTRREYDITAIGRGERPLWLPENVQWISIDLRYPFAPALLQTDWWGVVHLAAETLPSTFSAAKPVVDSLAMLLNLLDHLKSGRLLLVSSCHVYAPGCETKTEKSFTKPDGRYGLSKLLCETAALAAFSVDVRIARPFNHLGTGMRAELVVPSIVARIMATVDGRPIRMLGLDSIRDFLDVTDIVEAYLAILNIEAPTDRVFNVCSGRAVSIGQLVAHLSKAAEKENRAEFAQQAMSADDIPCLVGDAARLTSATGWRPTVSIDESARRIVVAHSKGSI